MAGVPGAARPGRRWGFWAAYGGLGTLLVAYAVSLLVRRPDQHWTWLDGWTVSGFEAMAAVLCIVRGATRRTGRAVPFVLGSAVLAWSLGDFFLTAESLGGATAPTPSIADVFYLAFYPLAYVGTVTLLRRSVDRLASPNWLDGAVAGLGASAVCACFAFHSVARLTGGTAASTATNLAYPIGDLLLLSLVVGGSALLPRAGKRPWLVLAAGITFNVVGDTFNLLQSSVGTSRTGMFFNAVAWPASLLLISVAVWLRPAAPDVQPSPRTAGFALPGAAAAAGLVVLLFASLHSTSRVALGLATATLVAVGVRLTISVRTLRTMTEERHRLSVTDELTGLGNRRQLVRALEAHFADEAERAEDGRRLAFLFIDLNRFKEINDSFGHPAGDELLREIGPRLRGAVRESDLVARLGGDELAVVLVDADADKARTAAERITRELDHPFTLRMMNARIGASIGIALAPTDAKDGNGLMWAADVAMYRAKLGGTPYAFYDQDLDGGMDALHLLEELRAAVEERQFVLHYQPQLDLRSGRVVAVEALIRWQHPRLGLVQPLKFLPLAEEAGLMRDLTVWALDEALAQGALWRRGGRILRVSVNISASNLLEAGFPELVQECLARHGLPAEALMLEITETSIITDFERSKAVIEHLRSLGVLVSIDDFGAGFTSLAYLSNLVVAELKLDRAFIECLGEGGRDRDVDLVRATIDLGHAMGLRVVAEGVEDDPTLRVLQELGCDLAQGYFISRPMPAEGVGDRVRMEVGAPSLVG